MDFLLKIFGDPNKKVVDSIRPIVEHIRSFREKYAVLSDAELRALTDEFRGEIRSCGEDYESIDRKLDEILPRAFAVIREAAHRSIGARRKTNDKETGEEIPYMAHFDVQLIGGVVLHRGQIAEMRTGEGKTLVATAPLYLNALAGKGAHLVTVNDYLSRIGAGWNGPLYHFLGMTTGVIVHDKAYVYDPEYLDDSQYDERLRSLRPCARRDAYQCDILYGTNNEFGFDYLRDNMVASLPQMVQRELYFAIVDEVDSILIDEARTPLIISAPAEESNDKYYKFAELVGRLVENEDYNVDEKMKAATLTEEGISKLEKWLGVENIYTAGGVRDVHHVEQALKAYVLFKKDRDYVVTDGEVIIVDEFTGRLMHGRRYSEGLHQAIEAKEGAIIQRESQTLATVTFQNYFRMYRKLAGMTGTAVTEAEEFSKIYKLETVVIPTNRPMVRKDMNDLIYKTELAKFKAVVEEAKSRSAGGQPVLVGTISIEKNEILAELFEREGINPNVLNAKNHEKEAYFIAQAGRPGTVTIATNMAGRGVDIILGGNPPDSQEQKQVFDAGGLHVIGTERHEARRIDNQLRGRAGRQGDPGSSRFYLSLEDDLMRIFGGDKMKNLMTTLRVPDDMPIENQLINRSIESAQRRVEGNNFDIRKHLVEYDDVINKHRESIYKRRREILAQAQGLEIKAEPGTGNRKSSGEEAQDVEASGESGQPLSEMILGMIENEIEQVVSFHTSGESSEQWNLEEIAQVASTIFPMEVKLKEEIKQISEEHEKLNKVKARTAIIEYLNSFARAQYFKMREGMGSMGFDFRNMEKEILVRSIDMLWVEHLEAMDYMRKGIGLRGYGQRDPLVEYKKEAYRMYGELQQLIQKQVVYSIFKIGDVSQMMSPSLLDRAKNFSAPAKETDSRSSSIARSMEADTASRDRSDLVAQKARDTEGNKIGRNDPCPCGSGKKYKKCCGK